MAKEFEKKENSKENKKEDMKVKKKETLSEKVKKKIDPKAKRIEELEKELAESKNDYLRTLAEFDNFRKRNVKELTEARDRAINNFVLDMLPAIDNFEMSLKMTDNREMFIKGVKMIHKNLIDVLKEHKIEEFSAEIGDEFDPRKHDPILVEDKSSEPGKVLAIVKKGYLQKNFILRPVRVKVAKEVEIDEKDNESEEEKNK